MSRESRSAGRSLAPFDPDTSYEERRKEPRQPIVRLVEYAPFPRVHHLERPRVGFTRNVSTSGLCLRVETVKPVGSLLRVLLRSVDGQLTRESIARVRWAQPKSDGSCWLGLSLLLEAPRLQTTPGPVEGPG